MHYNNQSDAASSNNIYVMESVFIIAVGAAENGAAEIGEQVAGHNSSSNITHVMESVFIIAVGAMEMSW